MSHDQIVTPRHLLDTQLLLARAGNGRFLRDLEQFEPELAHHLMESLSLFHSQLMSLGGPSKKTQQIYQSIESCFLICIYAQHKGHRELWDRELPDETGPPPRWPGATGVLQVLPPAKPSVQAPSIPFSDNVLTATVKCPLCGDDHHAIDETKLIDKTRCERSLQCFVCRANWTLIYVLADFGSLPTRQMG